MNEKHQPLFRRRKLIKPRLQLKMIGVFLGISALGFLLQAILMSWRLTNLAADLPAGGEVLQVAAPRLLVETLLLSFAILLPLTLAIGTLVTFRVAGPVYRFEQHLGRIVRGEAVDACRIRKHDEFQELCTVLNEAVDSLRAASGRPDGQQGEQESSRRAA